MQEPDLARGRRFASAVITIVLGLQALVVSRLACPPQALAAAGVGWCAPHLWPFFDFPMFSAAHRPGETVVRDWLWILHAGGGEALLERSDGVRDPAVRELFDALEFGQADAVEAVCARLERPALRVRLERDTLVLTRGGFVTARTQLLAERELALGGP